MSRTFQKKLLSAAGICILLIGILFAAPKIGLYFGSGNSIINDSIEFTIRYFSDWEYKIILLTLPLPKSIAKEEIEVYKAVLSDIEWISSGQDTTQNSLPAAEQRAKTADVLLFDTTSWEPRFEWDSLFHLIWQYGHPVMMTDFVRKNILAPRKHELDKHSLMIYSFSSGELSKLGMGRDFESHFHSAFPNVKYTCVVSRVGFDWNKRTAFVCVGRQAGPLSGDGIYYVLKKEGGHWIIKSRQIAWLS